MSEWTGVLPCSVVAAAEGVAMPPAASEIAAARARFISAFATRQLRILMTIPFASAVAVRARPPAAPGPLRASLCRTDLCGTRAMRLVLLAVLLLSLRQPVLAPVPSPARPPSLLDRAQIATSFSPEGQWTGPRGNFETSGAGGLQNGPSPSNVFNWKVALYFGFRVVQPDFGCRMRRSCR